MQFDPVLIGWGINFVRGSLNWGPLTWFNAVSKTFGWWTMRRSSYDKEFHTYALEWTDKFLCVHARQMADQHLPFLFTFYLHFFSRRIYVDSRLQHMLDLRFNVPFFQRGDFPTTISNASQEIILPNPWQGRGNSAPFDQCTPCPTALARQR